MDLRSPLPSEVARVGPPREIGLRPDTERASLIRLAVLGLLTALALRVVLLPTNGFLFDVNTYVAWTHDFAVGPLGQAYRHTVAYLPTLVYVFAGLGAIDPAFRTVTGAAGDPAILVAIKLPATLADFGMAALIAYQLRESTRWALLGALAVLLNPALWYMSAWWGQVDSLYLLPVLIAYVLAVSGRPLPAAVALGIGLMTKPQAFPLVIPFVAWSLGRYGVKRTTASALVLLGTVVLLWLPFIADGGPAGYIGALSQLPNGAFNVISFQAWNFWWILQLAAGADLVVNSTSIAGPLTFSVVGYLLAGIAELLVFTMVAKRPTARGLALGLACATLVAFAFLTTLHERYSVAAVVFLLPLLSEARVRWAWLGLSLLISWNIIGAVPASGSLGSFLPLYGPVGFVGSIGMLALTAWCLWLLALEPEVPGSSTHEASVANSRSRTPFVRSPGGLASMARRRREQILYLLFGGWNTVFGYGVWALFQFTLGDRLPYLAIVVLAWPVAVLNAYVVYRTFVFRSRGRVLTELPRFSLVYFLTLIVNLALLPVALRLLPFNIYGVQATFLAVVVVASYLGHRYFSFGGSRRGTIGGAQLRPNGGAEGD